MSRSLITLGPFLGGLNNATGVPDTIADNELVECVDFDYTVDGTLVTRPPVAIEPLPGGALNNTYFNLLGYFVYTSGVVHAIANIGTGLYYRVASTTYVDATSWVQITGSFGVATSGVQYNDKFYITKASAGGYSWNGTTGAAVGGIPSATSIAVFKERLWAASGSSSRLYFSNLATPETWSGSDFIDINTGDGQYLTTVIAVQSSLYLFKSNSTYVLTYDSAPTRGFVQNISKTVGTSSPLRVTVYESAIFVLYGSNVYRLDQYTYTRIGTKVSITRGATPGTYPVAGSISTVGDRIVICYKDLTFVYYPINNTWTQWDIGPISKFIEVANSTSTYGYKIYLGAINSNAPSTGSVVSIQDAEYATGMPEDMVRTDPRIKTKMYPMDSPHSFKRLHWWGIDAIISEANNQASCRLLAIPYAFIPYYTWTTLASMTWDQADNYSWADLLVNAYSTVTQVSVTSPNRKYIKAHNSLRFPRIQFSVQLTGYRHTASSSINHIVAEVSQKQAPVARSEGAEI